MLANSLETLRSLSLSFSVSLLLSFPLFFLSQREREILYIYVYIEREQRERQKKRKREGVVTNQVHPQGHNIFRFTGTSIKGSIVCDVSAPGLGGSKSGHSPKSLSSRDAVRNVTHHDDGATTTRDQPIHINLESGIHFPKQPVRSPGSTVSDP